MWNKIRSFISLKCTKILYFMWKARDVAAAKKMVGRVTIHWNVGWAHFESFNPDSPPPIILAWCPLCLQYMHLKSCIWSTERLSNKHPYLAFEDNFTARCHRLLLCLSVRLSVDSVRPWRWGTFFTQVGITSKIISRPNSLRLLLGLTPTWSIWCNGNTPKIRVE